ncbi:MAG: hypothetical protein ACYCPF_22395 [Streptosporangiaceae bacterium]
MSEELKAAAIARADQQVSTGVPAREVLASLWDEAFEQGRLAALDELQDRFCVCMK